MRAPKDACVKRHPYDKPGRAVFVLRLDAPLRHRERAEAQMGAPSLRPVHRGRSETKVEAMRALTSEELLCEARTLGNIARPWTRLDWETVVILHAVISARWEQSWTRYLSTIDRWLK